MTRWLKIWMSFRALPHWVQIWVLGILVPVNAVAFLLIGTVTGNATALAALFVVLTNVPIMWIEKGMSRLMSLPHLIAWIPLEIFLVAYLLRGAPNAVETAYAIIVLIINGISLILDGLDSWRWVIGKREIPGKESL